MTTIAVLLESSLIVNFYGDITFQISGSRGGEYEDDSLLGYSAV
jgi:hypothetical protein